MKKVMSAILSCAMLIVMLGTTVVATGENLNDTHHLWNSDNPGINTQCQNIDAQLSVILTSIDYSQNLKQNAIAKAERIKKWLSDLQETTETYSARIDRKLTVPFYPQETGFNCGPASVQQTLGAYGAPVPNQSDVAEDLGTAEGVGTDNSAIVTYLNTNLSDYRAVFETWWNSSSKNMKTVVVNSIDIAEPIILHIKDVNRDYGRKSYNDTSKWLFKTSGHYLSISGYSSDGDQLEVTDPNTLRATSDESYSTGKYFVDYDIVNKYADRIIL